MNILSGGYSVRCRRLTAIVGVAGAALSLSVATAAMQPSTASEVGQGAPAAWQSYDLNFHYFGFTTYYSCSGLENRLEQILREMGADQDLRVSASGCFGAGDIGNMLSARIRVRMPVAPSESQPETFLAASKPVTLRSGANGAVGAGDCELLEQVRDQLLPALKIQLVQDDLRCVPGQANYSGRSLQVMALLPEPAK